MWDRVVVVVVVVVVVMVVGELQTISTRAPHPAAPWHARGGGTRMA
jgi:hypothetical protein